LKTKVEGAAELAKTVPETEAYKKALEVPVVAAVAAPKKSEEKKEDKPEAKEEKKEAKEEKKTDRKSRSASRKRNSIFGTFLGKKEEKTEAPKEETPVATATEEPAAESTPAVVEPVVAAETVEAAPVVEASPASPTTEERPAASKRNSIFGTIKSQFSSHKKPEPEAPVVPAKDAEPVSETAPVIPAPEASEPLAAAVASPETVATETTESPATNGDAKVETPVVKTDKRKSSLPWLNKKKDVPSSDDDTEKPKSPFAKLRATVKGKKTDKPAETAAATEPAKAAEEPVVSEPTPVVPAASPQVSATA